MVIHTVVKLHKCDECATCTTDPPNSIGLYHCDRHKDLTSLLFRAKIEPELGMTGFDWHS